MSQRLGRVVLRRAPFLGWRSRRRRRTSRLSLLVLLLVAACSGSPASVERITIANPTEYDIDVEVTGGNQEGWLPLVIVEARSEDVVQNVIDQGDVWVFRFEYVGDPIEEVRLARSELERNGWRVEIPPEVGERLHELGRPTSEELTGAEPGDGG